MYVSKTMSKLYMYVQVWYTLETIILCMLGIQIEVKLTYWHPVQQPYRELTYNEKSALKCVCATVYLYFPGMQNIRCNSLCSFIHNTADKWNISLMSTHMLPEHPQQCTEHMLNY